MFTANLFRRAMLLPLVCLPLLTVPHASWAGQLTVTPIPAAQTVVEGINTSVTFRVTNTTGQDLVLDYALAIINGPPGDSVDSDNVFFNGVTFPTASRTILSVTLSTHSLTPTIQPTVPTTDLTISHSNSECRSGTKRELPLSIRL